MGPVDTAAALLEVLGALPAATPGAAPRGVVGGGGEGGVVLVAEPPGGGLAGAVRAAGYEVATASWPGLEAPAGPIAAVVLAGPFIGHPDALAAVLRSDAEELGPVPLVLVSQGWPTPLDEVSSRLVGVEPGEAGAGWRLERALQEAGFTLLAASEVTRRPPTTPVLPGGLEAGSPAPDGVVAAAWSASLAGALDGEGTVSARVSAHALDPAGPTPAPFLTVVLRTQGRRPGQLREALLCLSAQTDDRFELLLVVHRAAPSDEGGRRAVQEVVDDLPPGLASRARVLDAVGGGRGRPLNVGLAHARGEHVAFLDDDDLVTADWVEAFAAGAAAPAVPVAGGPSAAGTGAGGPGAVGRPGVVVRSLTARQDVQAVGGAVGYQPVGPFTVPYREAFDYADHLVANQSPICSVALPRAVLDAFGLRVDETLAALEDWDLLLRTAPWCGVVDTGVVTSIYHYWVDGSGSDGAEGRRAWEDARRRVLARLASRPLVATSQVAADLVAMADEAEAARQLVFAAEGERDEARARLAAVERSRFWRATLPFQAAARRARRLRQPLARLARLVEPVRRRRPRPR